MEELKERLDEIVDRERSRLSFEPSDDARMRETFLDALPPDVPGQIGELKEYRFIDPEAQRLFDELLEHVKEQVLGSYFRQLAQGMRDVTPEQMARFKDMLSELNGLLEARARGEDTQPAFEDFMQRYGDLFPEDPRTLDELLEQMARRMAAMSRLLASLSPEQREELQGLVDQVMQDMDLAFEMDRLGANLQGMFPDAGWGEGEWGEGEDAMPMSATVDALERMHDYEELDRSIEGAYPGAALEDVDEEALRRTLGEPSVQDLRRLKQIEKMLEDAGLVQRTGGPPRGDAARREEDGRARPDPRLRAPDARPRGHARGARSGRPGGTDRPDAAVAVRRPRHDRGAAHGVQRGHPRRRARTTPACGSIRRTSS